jgi:hypothetical protein
MNKHSFNHNSGDEDIEEKSEYISGTDIVKDIIVEGYAGD